MIFIVILVFLALLAGCGWGLYLSVRLIFRSAQRMFAPAPAFAPPAVLPPEHVIPSWTAKLVGDHLATCATCRASYVAYTLARLEPSTISRILALIEAETPVAP